MGRQDGLATARAAAPGGREILPLGARALPQEPPGPTKLAMHAARGRRLIVGVRLGAVVLAGALETVHGTPDPLRTAVFAVVLLHGLARARWQPTSRGAWVDTALAAVAIALTGGASSSYTPYGLIAAIGAGVTLEVALGAAAGAVVALAAVPSLASYMRAGVGSWVDAAMWATLFPIAGAGGGLGWRLWRSVQPGSARLLAQTNHALNGLYRLARSSSVGLEIGSVAGDALGRMREQMRAPAGLFLSETDGALSVAGSFGVTSPERVTARDVGRLREGDARVLIDVSSALAPHPCWLLAPVRRGDTPLGALLAACRDHAMHEEDLCFLVALADDVSMAVENVRLFHRIRDLSIDEERHRIARDLHDGVAQALAHLRFELSFIASNADARVEDIQTEAARLGRVAERAMADVRAAVQGLRAGPQGLLASLDAFLADLRGAGGGPRIVFEHGGEVSLSPVVEAELFRIAQEAVSNAMRHARAGEIRVVLREDAAGVRLSVEDDGAGVQARSSLPGGGVGMSAMGERAERIGARLSLEPRAGGGTRVALVLPQRTRLPA